MTEYDHIPEQLAGTRQLMREKLGVKGATLALALRKGRRLLPRHIRSQVAILARAEPFADHPKLRLTLDTEELDKATRVVHAHLNDIDMADKRKGWWLGMLGGLAFNLLLFVGLVLTVYYWRVNQ